MTHTLTTIADTIAHKLQIPTHLATTITTRVLDQLGHPTHNPHHPIPAPDAHRIINAAHLVTKPSDNPAPMTQGADDTGS